MSLPKGVTPGEVSLDYALKLLALPRALGTHPDSGKTIEAGIGRFGPYVRYDGEYRSLTKDDDVLTVGLERALELLAQEKGRRKAAILRELGHHPDDGETVGLYKGRYGPYVKHGKINASLPKDLAADDVTLKQALELIAKKKANSPKKRTRKKKKS